MSLTTDGRTSCVAECPFWIVHDGVVIISANIYTHRNMFFKILMLGGFDVVPVDGDVFVSIGTRLFVKQTYRMADFVDNRSKIAIANIDFLHSTLPPYIRPTAQIVAYKLNIVTVSTGAGSHADVGVVADILYCIQNHTSFGMIVLNGIGNNAILPAVIC